MASSRLTSFLLVLFILLHAKYSTAQAQEKRVADDGTSFLQVMNQEISGAAMAGEVRNQRLKGRKMMVKCKEEGVKVEERKNSVSGKDIYASNKHSQQSSRMKEKAAGNTRSEAKCSSNEKLHINHDQTAKVIVNFMNKDYSGGGGPLHMPPIHH
ncbi:uncharacterized protein [Euphorbia lathyris]|uniref:uncharacterized protein n=1 Tax=Euphorbia lathyris TaxID=212925 RepID=UPI0033142EFB